MLEHVSLFENLTKNQIAELETIGKPLPVPKNTIVINEGDKTDSLYIIMKGKAYAFRNDSSGRQLIVNRFNQYDYFGEMSFFDGQIRSASVVTKERSKLMVIPRQEFFDFTAKNPEIFWNVSKTLIQKLRKATEQIEELAFRDVYSRLTRFLTENQDKAGVLAEKFTQQELADTVGATRETICRILNELTIGGYLGKQDDRIVIIKPLPYKF